MLKRDEDFFKDTTMTFGEHLDELRTCLVRAVYGLVIGVGIGLYFGNDIVRLIERPLVAALGDFYMSEAEKRYVAWMNERTAAGLSVPYTEKQVKYLVGKKQLLYEIRYLDVTQVLNALATNEPRLREYVPPAHTAEKVIEPDELVPAFFWHPVSADERISPSVFSVQEGFMIWFKAASVFGIVLASPWIFYQVWAFVAAGLYPHEKKYIHIFLPFSIGLFLLGAGMAYLFVFQPVLSFLFNLSGSLGFKIDPRISEWMSFVIFLPLGFGISFQLPLVMLFLERIGIFNVQAYLERWRIAILVIFVLSAILTPADPYTIFFMAIPLTFLYFGGVLLCRWLPRGKFAVEPVD
ncbi:MAG TPA: twin-arginine translocase subunit TatC [Pirellulales bacterium]|nr:twin-arginine translocase subunit TatC [Pirellulales bacterium]